MNLTNILFLIISCFSLSGIAQNYIYTGKEVEGYRFVVIKADTNERNVITAKKTGFINTKGQLLFESNSTLMTNFSEGLAISKKDGLYGYIDKSGNWVIPPKFKFVTEFKNGKAFAGVNSLNEGYINKKGEFIKKFKTPKFAEIKVQNIPLQEFRIILDAPADFHYNNGLALIGGYIYDEELKIKYIVSKPKNSKSNLILIKNKERKWGYLDKNSFEIIINPQFDEADHFDGTYAKVGIREEGKLKYYLINFSGKKIKRL